MSSPLTSNASSFPGIVALACILVSLAGPGVALEATPKAPAKAAPKVPLQVHEALAAYLRALPKDEKAARDKALKALKGDLALAAEALRTLPPLSSAKPGTEHSLEFTSGGRPWEYSIHLPRGYDGTKRFPVLVLPDHASVDAESGLGFWKDKEGSEDYVLFRPVILRHKDDRTRFPDGPFFAVDQAVALVMADALVHLRRHYAVDADRICMTGLSQAGYYTWYYAASFPDQFAGIVPESAGGMAVRSAVQPLAPNLSALAVRILHARGDEICPYADATAMRDAIAAAGGQVELITYEDADYGANLFPKRHPGPHGLRLENVLLWAAKQKRVLPEEFTRILRYRQQGREGRFVLEVRTRAPESVSWELSEKDGKLKVRGPAAARYRVSPEDILSGRKFEVRGKVVKPKVDLGLLLSDWKALHDPGRLSAAEILVPPEGRSKDAR